MHSPIFIFGPCIDPAYSCFDYAGASTSSLIHNVETALALFRGSVFITSLMVYELPCLLKETGTG